MAESEKSRKENKPVRAEKASEKPAFRPADTVAAATAEAPIEPPKLADGERLYEGMWLVRKGRPTG